MAQRSARDRLLDAASTMFYRDGINATGIDRVIAGAGVAKASLYNNFASKDELIAAYLERHREHFVARLHELDTLSDPSERLAQFFAGLARSAREATFAGCPFAKAAVEVRPDSPAHRVIERFYGELARFFARALGAAPDDPAVTQLVVCYDGALSAARFRRDPSCVAAAAALAQSILTVRRGEPAAPDATI